MSERVRESRSRTLLRFAGISVAFVLTIVAVWMIALGHSQREVSLGVITGLWAALIGAMTFYGGRHSGTGVRGPQAASGTEMELREDFALELQREVSARRAYEQQLHEMVRREIETIQRVVGDQLGRLREDVATLRSDLVDQVGGKIRLERIETTRVIGSDIEALQNEVRQLAGSRITDGRNKPADTAPRIVEAEEVAEVAPPAHEPEITPRYDPYVAPTYAPAVTYSSSHSEPLYSAPQPSAPVAPPPAAPVAPSAPAGPPSARPDVAAPVYARSTEAFPNASFVAPAPPPAPEPAPVHSPGPAFPAPSHQPASSYPAASYAPDQGYSPAQSYAPAQPAQPRQPVQSVQPTQPVQPYQPSVSYAPEPAYSPPPSGPLSPPMAASGDLEADPFAGLPRLSRFDEPIEPSAPTSLPPLVYPVPEPQLPPPQAGVAAPINGSHRHAASENDQPEGEPGVGRRRRAEGETNDILARLLDNR